MNKTKRKIFETSMKLFAEKGYDATSVEEITSIVGVAKGTLYYHFSSKEEIFYFLVEEGMKLLQNSITIKTAQQTSSIEKLKSVMLIQTKILNKYRSLPLLIFIKKKSFYASFKHVFSLSHVQDTQKDSFPLFIIQFLHQKPFPPVLSYK